MEPTVPKGGAAIYALRQHPGLYERVETGTPSSRLSIHEISAKNRAQLGGGKEGLMSQKLQRPSEKEAANDGPAKTP